VRDSVAHGNVTGIEIENTVNAVVEGNHVYDNAGGILVFVLPNNPSKAGRACRVVRNRVIANNHVNFGDPNAIVSKVPAGTGIMIMAADETEVTDNEIRGNDSFGIAVVGLDMVFPSGTTFDVGSVPEHNRIHGNRYADNGRRPAPAVREVGLSGADLLWDLNGASNVWHEPAATRATPLLDARWPEPLRRAYWRALRLLQRLAS
jgi:parallel beta-helix repeat protein